jgi:nitrogen regulatory protein P-II 1
MKIVTAFARTTSREDIVKSLQGGGVRSMTIEELKGIGEEARLDRVHTIHDRIDIIVTDEKADQIVNVILKHGRTGLAGEGLVSVQPADYAIKIRTKEKLT